MDGKKATTHWRYLDRLAKDNPRINVETDSIYVYDNNVITSVGVTSGMDLALSLVEEDISREVAMSIAQNLVIYYHRSGGQQQFPAPLKIQSLENQIFRQLCLEIIEHPGEKHSVENMAERVNMSARNFSRRFTQDIGISPGKFVEKVRLDTAKRLLEDSHYPIEKIAKKIGFSGEVLRRSFLCYYGITPSKHREQFGAKGTY